MQEKPELTVFYNTSCPVCDAGINMQKNKLVQAVKAGIIEFRDINLEPGALARFGSSVDDVRRRLHALDPGGELLIGADVAVAIWRRRPGQNWLARLTGNKLILPFSRFVYDRFADVLFAWNRRKGRF